MWGTKSTGDRLNLGTKEELEVTGYVRDRVKTGLTVVATLLTGGLLLLLLTWRPSIKLALTHRRCSLKDAHTLLLKDIYGQEWEEEVVREEAEGETRLHFINKKLKYVWDDATCTYSKLRPMEHAPTFSTFHQRAGGLTEAEASRRLALFGENLMKIDILSVWQLLVQQAVNPFYIFQAFTVILWCLQTYFLYSACIVILSVISISLMVWETRRQSRALRKKVTSQSEMAVLRDGRRVELSSLKVVPGDVVLLADGHGKMEVDAVLLEGSVVTNEAMLTGESVPITKVGVPRQSDALFYEEEHKQHLLFSGTQVMQVRGAKEVPALVINTGFHTARGELVRAILFPKPLHFSFYSDFLKMLAIFLLLGLAAVGWSIHNWIVAGRSFKKVVFSSMDLITFVVPPILPATITAINGWAQRRLKRQHIYCLSSNYISLSGSVDHVCFDKTGTLTEEDLALAGVLPASRGDFGQPQEDLMHLSPIEPLTKALATCHSLITVDGILKGYPVDVKIFTGIAWTLQQPQATVNPDYGVVTPVVVQPRARIGVDPRLHELAILRTFPFEAREQRMTVVAKARGSNIMEVFIKGAPERVASLCQPKTVPGLMETVVAWYTRQGLRVLAVAGKSLSQELGWEQVQVLSREELEKNATFLGLVLLQNKLKVETATVLKTLHEADITTAMVTGDSLLTALTVARQSGLVPSGHQIIIVKAVMEASSSMAAQHLKVYYYDAEYMKGLENQRKLISVRNDNYALATDGETFELLANGQDKTLFYRVLHKGRVFARMKPEQKVTVVETLQDLGHHVAMCGDGCNDCGALKVANSGISLSSAEGSVAAPFTSRLENITCVPLLIREGRAVLVSIFCTFKYTVVACFGALICVIMHFVIYTEPTDTQYVILDLLLMTMPALVMGCTGASPRLTPQQPTHRILSFLPAVSMVSFLGFQALAYWALLTYLQTQPWFHPFSIDDYVWPPPPNYENTTLVIVSFYFAVIAAFIFSHAAPYRKPFYTNYVLTGYLVFATVFCIFTNFYKGEWFLVFLNFVPIPEAGFAGVIFFSACIGLVICFLWERWFLYGVVENYILPWFKSVCGRRPLHAKIEQQLKEGREWPVLNEPPKYDGMKASSLEELLVADETLETGEDNEKNAMFIRKLTRRHHFNATVAHVTGNRHNSTSSSVGADAATISVPPPSPNHEEPTEHVPLTDQQSAGYKDPWDSLEHGRGESPFKFNQSVRQQIMKGTGGAFKTFRGSIKRQAAVDDAGAQPYEVVPLAHCPPDPQEAIYSTISETTTDEYSQPYGAADTTREGSKETKDEKEVGAREDTQWNSEIWERETHVENLQKMGRERINWRIKKPDADDDNQSLMQHMNVAWRRISGSPLLPLGSDRKIDVYRQSSAERRRTQDLLYDIPKPPRPVQAAYSPTAPKASSTFPEDESDA